MRAIHKNDAIRILESGEPCDLRLWKMSTGDILFYKGAICVGSHFRGGTHRVKLPVSGVIREFRDISLFEINKMSVYL